MTTSVDRTTKILLMLLVIGVWGLLLRPLFTLPDAHAQNDPPVRARTIDTVTGPTSPNPSMVVVGPSVYVAGDGYISQYDTNSGTSLRLAGQEKLPSDRVVRLPVPPRGQELGAAPGKGDR